MTIRDRIVAGSRALAPRVAALAPSRLTSGQRFTTALALALAVVVVAFGVPRHTVTQAAPAFGSPRPAPTGGLRSDATPTAAPARDLVEPTDRIGFAARSEPLTPVGRSTDASTPMTSPRLPPAEARVPDIVALVRANAMANGRDDATIAAKFLSRAGFAYTTVVFDPADVGLCDALQQAGDVVMVGWHGLPTDLRDCLVDAGLTVVGFDAGGDAPGASGEVVSTRRGTTDSLVDLARSSVATAIQGRLGVVASTAQKAAVERALDRAGIKPVATAYLDPSPADAPQIADAVEDFVAKNVEVTLFATTVTQQSRFAVAHRAIAPNVRFIVADTDDAIVNEAHAAVFDGALTYTSYRLPWFARTHGETAPQQACRTAWEQSLTPPQVLSNIELANVFAWCGQADIVAAALASAAAGTPFSTAVRAFRVDAPLTSVLGPLGDGRWGPTQSAALTWSLSCRCWNEAAPFATRTAA